METTLQYVYMVYWERSFTRAAEKLYISQPSLSAMVRKAEQQFGTPIFDRSEKPLQLTEAGQAYIAYIERIMQAEETLNEQLWDIQHLSRGKLRLGGSNYVLSNIAQLILRRMMPAYPGIEIELVEEKSYSLRRMLEEGELDLVIDSFDLTDKALIYDYLLEEQILLAVPEIVPETKACAAYRISANQLRRKNGICDTRPLPEALARQLLQKSFILLKPENDMYQRAKSVFDAYGLLPKTLLQLDQLMTCLQYTRAGLGCSFVTDTLFRYGESDRGICLYRLSAREAADQPQGPCRQLCVAHKRGKYVSNASRLLIQTAKEVLA